MSHTPTDYEKLEQLFVDEMASLRLRLHHMELRIVSAMTAQTDAIVAAVAANRDVVNSAITLLTRLTALVQANINDPVALQGALDSINAEKADLAAAVAANTPADPNAPPAPAPAPTA